MSTGTVPVSALTAESSRSIAPASERITWVDTFRGLSIFLVVVGHVLGGLAMASFVGEGDKGWLWGVHHWIYTFRMPAFFVASGLFAARSLRRGFPNFLSNKLRTLAYPYLLWSWITWALHSAASGMTNTQADPWAFLKMFYDPSKGVWFLYVLFAVMIVYGLWTTRGGGRWGFLALGVLAHEVAPVFASLPILLDLVARFAVYFGLGIVIASEIRGVSSRLTLSWLLILTPISFGLMKAAVALGLDQNRYLDLIPALAGTAGLFGSAMLIDRLWATETVWHWGRHSLQIYLAGGFASVFTRIALHRGLGLTAPVPHLVLGVLAGVFFPLALVALCRAIGFRYLFTWPAPSACGSSMPRSASPPFPVGAKGSIRQTTLAQ